MIKDKLLATGMFSDNSYLDKYCDLIISNLNTNNMKGETQRHHIIPISYFKLLNISCDNSEDNLVNLTYKDHILAHYFLERCISNDKLRGKNFFAIYKLCGSAKISKEELYHILEDNELLDEFITYKNYETIFSAEHRQKLSEVDKIMIYVWKDNIQTKIYPDQLEKYLSEGWISGGLPGRLSPEHKAALAASHKNISDKFKKEQSKRLKDFYANNPNWKTKSKRAVVVINPNTNEEMYFQSCIDLCNTLEIPIHVAKAGIVSTWIKLGYIKRKKSKYHKWVIRDADRNCE